MLMMINVVFGRIDKVRLLPQKNCAFVNFTSVDEALAARNNLQGKVFYDRQIRIKFGRVRVLPPPLLLIISSNYITSFYMKINDNLISGRRKIIPE